MPNRTSSRRLIQRHNPKSWLRSVKFTGPNVVLQKLTLLALPGIFSGTAFAFATSLDEVLLTLFVAGRNQHTLARQMFYTIHENISSAVAAAAFVFIAGTILIAIATNIL